MIIILHLPDSARIGNGLSNAKNLLSTEDFSDNDMIYIILNGSAVAAIIDADIPPVLRNDVRVKLVLCKNSLIANHILDAQIPPFYVIVPSAIQEIVRLQATGAFYVRP